MSLRSPDLFRAWDDEYGHLPVVTHWGTVLCFHCGRKPTNRRCKG